MWPRTMHHSSEADVIHLQRIGKLRVVNAGMVVIRWGIVLGYFGWQA